MWDTFDQTTIQHSIVERSPCRRNANGHLYNLFGMTCSACYVSDVICVLHWQVWNLSHLTGKEEDTRALVTADTTHYTNKRLLNIKITCLGSYQRCNKWTCFVLHREVDGCAHSWSGLQWYWLIVPWSWSRYLDEGWRRWRGLEDVHTGWWWWALHLCLSPTPQKWQASGGLW